MTRALRLSSRDDVAILIDPAEAGGAVLGVVAGAAIPAGHS